MHESSSHTASVPAPPSERGAWLLACLVASIGLVVLVAVLTGLVGRSATVAPPPIVLAAPTPAPGPASAASALAAAGHAPASRASRRTVQRGLAAPAAPAHVSARWMEGFYPIYETAQSTFGVNWLLLAAIHMQET